MPQLDLDYCKDMSEFPVSDPQFFFKLDGLQNKDASVRMTACLKSHHFLIERDIKNAMEIFYLHMFG